MLKKIILISLFLLIIRGVQSQKVNIEKKPVKENFLVTSKIIGSIDSSIYVATSVRIAENSLRLSVYNKETTDFIKTIIVKKYGDKKTILKNAKFDQAYIKNNLIYLVWIVENKKESRIILQVYDRDLSEIQSPKIIYEFINPSQSYTIAHPFILISPDGSKIIAGGEEPSDKGNNIKLQYKLMNKQLEVINSTQVELPFSIIFKPNKTSSKYKMDNQGFLFLNTAVVFYELKIEKKGQLIGSINPENSELKYHVFTYENKELTNLHYEIRDEKLFVYGVYKENTNSDNKRKNKDNLKQGIYSITLDKQLLTIIGEDHFEIIQAENIVYSDLQMDEYSKSKSTSEAYALNHINSRDLAVTECHRTSDDCNILVLNNQTYLSDGTVTSTTIEEIYYVKLMDNGKIKWVSCTEQKSTFFYFVDFKNSMIKKEDSYYSVRPYDKMNIIYKINETTGFISKSKSKKEYLEEVIKPIDNEIYYVGLKHSRYTKNAFIGLGISAVGLTISAIVFPYIIPVFVITGYVSTAFKGSNVYFGKFDFHNTNSKTKNLPISK